MEEGPELVSMPRGAKVTPNEETEKMFKGISLNISNFYNNREDDIQKIAEKLGMYIRREGLV